MPLFQNTVVTKYLKGQNSEKINSKWSKFKMEVMDNEKLIERDFTILL